VYAILLYLTYPTPTYSILDIIKYDMLKIIDEYSGKFMGAKDVNPLNESF